MLYRSENLKQVHPLLVKLVMQAAATCPQPFAVYEGVRSEERQRELLAKGATRTMRSKHLLQPDGLSHAVDLVPMIEGKLAWDWPALYSIAAHMVVAAGTLLKLPGCELLSTFTWGGVWDRRLHLLGDTAHEVKAYGDRRRAAKLPVFTDGPHFQVGA